MFEILLNEVSDQPIYMALYTHIRNDIRNGVIANGTRLPSIRTLQIQLNISKTPIETAYQMLISEGYVISKPRSGLYVVSPYHAPVEAEKKIAEKNLVLQTSSDENKSMYTKHKRWTFLQCSKLLSPSPSFAANSALTSLKGSTRTSIVSVIACASPSQSEITLNYPTFGNGSSSIS